MGININSLPFSFLINTSIPVSKAPVLVTTFKKAPKIKINKLISMADWNPKSGANNVWERVAPTTPLPFTISPASNWACGSKIKFHFGFFFNEINIYFR